MPVQTLELTHVYMPDSPFQALALDHVNLTIQDGEFVGVIGHTGSGKSTLIQHLNGLLKPSSGTVIVDGLDLSQKATSLKEVRRRVGLVFQYPEYQLFEETVFADIAFGPKNLGLAAQEIERRVRTAMEWVKLDAAMGDKSPFELSGGQKRRVAIAGVLAMDPKLLILDEPTAGLDPRGRDAILELIGQWHALGKSIVMVSHSMDDVARFAGRILVMNKGKLAMSGTPEEIFARCEELSAIGLDVPAVTKLAQALRAAGWRLPGRLNTMEEMEEALARAIQGGEADA